MSGPNPGAGSRLQEKRPVRRLMTALPLSLLLLLAAVPAFAAEEEFSGSFAGLGYAIIAGIVLGIVYFAVLHTGESEADEYEDHH